MNYSSGPLIAMNKKPIHFEQLTALCDEYDRCAGLECDGMTNVLHTILTNAGIEHEVWRGKLYAGHPLTKKPLAAPLHFWIVVGGYTGVLTIDYRARMWCGDRAEIPHGVFNQIQFPWVTYDGAPLPNHPVLSPMGLQVLTLDVFQLPMAELLKRNNLT